MVTSLQRTRGLTLIELAVTLLIASILVVIAIPTFSDWIRNARIRTTVESIQNGIQLARAEAIRRNRAVQFQLTSAPGGNWVVGCANPVDNGTAGFEDAGDCLAQIDARTAAGDNTERTAIVTTPADARTVTFNSLGLVINNVDGSSILTQVDADDAGGGGRALRVVIQNGGGIRMCDPALPVGDVRRC